MQFTSIQRIVGLLLMMFSLTMLPPIGIAWIYEEASAPPFIVSLLLIAGAGAALWFPARRSRRDLRLRDGFVIVRVGRPDQRRRVVALARVDVCAVLDQ